MPGFTMDTTGFELATRRLIELRTQINRTHGKPLPELDLGSSFSSAPPLRAGPGRRRASRFTLHEAQARVIVRRESIEDILVLNVR